MLDWPTEKLAISDPEIEHKLKWINLKEELKKSWLSPNSNETGSFCLCCIQSINQCKSLWYL
jgi:hypothetical protein